ncbi:hypothetical protein BDV98DRAFT_395019 [Pterulicium gracile]|uniref:Uncharacterized protein n=1 Tax=Pterulicium gracile TaxID=1884261 RepID=A0A5C3QS47_9AGAR|nr:hypothetical protein BDV98DRAFT_395019 [Pterula gracilis]
MPGMATYSSIGSNDVTKEAQNVKDKLASKDAQISAQETKLLKQGEELEDIREILNETLHKLNTQTKRALSLESDLEARSEQLQIEKISSQNAQIALKAANESLKSKDLETRELQTILDSLSNKSTGDITKLQQEKLAAEKKVRQLEASIQDMKNAPVPPPSRLPTRGRSSSLSNFKISNLEHDTAELRSQLSRAQQDLSQANQKASHLNSQVMKLSNENTAAERKFTSRIDELEMLRNNAGNSEREAELMQRIEADEAQIEALQTMLQSNEDVKALQRQLKAVEAQLKQRQHELTQREADNTDLVMEKEAILDELDSVKADAEKLENQLSELKNIDTSTEKDAALSELKRMFPIIGRLRDERNEARRQLEFIEAEQRFTVEALEKAKSDLRLSSGNQSASTRIQAQAEALQEKASLVVNAFAIVIRHTFSRSELALSALHSAAEASHAQHAAQKDRIAVLEERLDVTSQGLAGLTQERDDLQHRLADEETTVFTLQSNVRDQDLEIEHLNHLLTEKSKELRTLEAERNSLDLQITNLNNDLEAAQEELTDAEGRYSSLQAQQLNNMSSTQVVASLKRQIQELDGRVMRRMETIGLLQHDVKRLETNLKLQEERIVELAAELEEAEADKKTMLEDCADARALRDEEHARVEMFEEQVEVLEETLEGREREVVGTIKSYMAFVGKSRIQRRTESGRMVERIESLQASLKDVQKELGEYTTEVGSLRSQAAASSQSSQQEQRDTTLDSDHRLAELQDRLDSETSQLRSSLEAKIQEHAQLQTEYDELDDEFAMSRQQTADLSQTIDHLLRSVEEEKQAAQVVQEKVDLLEAKLKAAFAERAELESKYAVEATEAEEEHRGKLEHWQKRCDELDGKLMAALAEKSSAETKVGDLEKQLIEARRSGSEDSDQLAAIQQRLDDTTRQLETSKAAQVEVQALLDEARSSLASADEAKEKIDAELEQASAEQERLNEEIACLSTQLEEQSALQDSTAAKVSELEDSVETAKAQHVKERSALEEKVQTLSQSSSTKISALQTEAESLKEEMAAVQEQLQEVEEERDVQQMEVTTLTAEVQQLTSLKRHNEAQLRDAEKKLAAITATLEETNQKLAESNKLAQTSSADLTMQVIRHQQEIDGLKKEIAVWEAKPRLDDMLSELEEKNNELEELLRAKSEEIDENDEKILEILQEKKKALAKVDSLTRKVQLLQTKLVAMKSLEAPAQPQPPALPRASSSRSIQPKASHESVAFPLQPPPVPRPSSSRSIEQSVSQEPVAQRSSSSRSIEQSVSQEPVVPRASSSRSIVSAESVALPPSRPSSVASGSMGSSQRDAARRSTSRSSPHNIPIPDYIPAPPQHRSSSPNRAVSGPSGLPRPKTPERKSAAPVVFRAKTPDPSLQMDTTSLAGKKRRTPDEHEPEPERHPAQLFTTESTPAGTPDFSAGITPRTRTLSNTPHAGFTPRRRPAAVVNDRPVLPVPAPKTPRITVQSATNEPENNPSLASQSTRPAKKTWLGKIRGGASARP